MLRCLPLAVLVFVASAVGDAPQPARRLRPAPEDVAVSTLAVSRDGTLLATRDDDCRVAFWDLRTGEQVGVLGNEVGPEPLLFLSDGRLLVGSGEGAEAADVAGRKAPQRFAFRTGTLAAASASADGSHLVVSTGCSCSHLWDVKTGREVRPLGPVDRMPTSVALAPDGKLLALAWWTGELALVETDSGKTVRNLLPAEAAPRAPRTHLAFAPDGRTLASWSQTEGTARFWDVDTGRLRAATKADKVGRCWREAMPLAFSADGRTLALVNDDDRVILLEAETGGVRYRHPDKATCVAFAGRTLLTGTLKGEVLFWDLRGVLGAATFPEPAAVWADLAGDAGPAYRAIQTLARHPGPALRLLRERLRPVSATDGARVARLIADLDADDFDTRERASAALAKLGETVLPALQAARANTSEPEPRRRLDELLKTLDGPPTAERLRALRAIEALEAIGSPPAVELLVKLAGGADGFRKTAAARAALARLRQPPENRP